MFCAPLADREKFVLSTRTLNMPGVNAVIMFAHTVQYGTQTVTDCPVHGTIHLRHQCEHLSNPVLFYSTYLCIYTYQNHSSTSFSLSNSTRRRFYPQRSSGQAVVTGVVPFSPSVRAFNFYRAQGSALPLLVDFHRMLLTHALALSANLFLCKKKSPRVCALSTN